jgi:chemotaxis protein histidine kinase CheA
MAERELGFMDYLRAAFVWKVPIGGLGMVPINLFILPVFIVLGLLNPGFWFLGGAVEIGYLAALAGNSRFQKLVQGMAMARKKGVPSNVQERHARLIEALDPASRSRYQALSGICAAILTAADSGGGPVRSVELESGGLGQLLWIFLKLLASRQRISLILAQTSRKDIEAEIAETTERLSRETKSSPLYRSLTGTLDIQKKRLDNLIKAAESLAITEAELERIEKQVALMREETSVSSDPELISVRLDGIVDSLQGTTKWMTEHDEIFSRLDSETLPPELFETEGGLSRRNG